MADLRSAQKVLWQNRDNEIALIWVARRHGYLGDYNAAISVLTDGLRQFPDSARLYRHRGHRFITVRDLQQAESDLVRAAALADGHPDQIEPDGMPNKQNIPRSTTNSNIFYHLALARYLQSEYAEALEAIEQCLKFCTNDDMSVATLYWTFLTLVRLDRADEARALLDGISPEMDIIENDGYHRLLLLFKGELEESDLLGGLEEGIATPTVLYGVSQYRALRGDAEGSREILDRIIEGGAWPAFGYIAAEADLVRMGEGG